MQGSDSKKIISIFGNMIDKFTDSKLGVVVGKMPKEEAKLVNASSATKHFDRKSENIKITYHDYASNEIKSSGFYVNPDESLETNLANLWQNLIDHAKSHIDWEKLFNR